MWQSVAKAIRATNPKRVVFAMDGGHDTRSAMFPDYKAHRPESPDLLKAQKELAEESIRIAGFCAVRMDGWEADDVLATIATKHPGTVIVSADKDLLAMAGRARIYHPWKDGAFVSAEEKLNVTAWQVTDFLALCGDSSDGIPGVPGIGPKGAAALLQKHGNLEAILAAAITSQIGGANAKKLKDGRASALLSHDLIKLNESLALPELHPWRPQQCWQASLADKRLGSVAAIIDGFAEVISDRPRAQESEVISDRPREQESAPPKAVSRVHRKANSAPETSELTSEQIWSDGSRETRLVACWEIGRAAGPENECPWKKVTEYGVAWMRGRAGDDLDIGGAESKPAERASKPAERESKAAEREPIPQPRAAQRSLF